MIYLSVQLNKSGDAVLPTYWGSNYSTLLPGETHIVHGTFGEEGLNGEKAAMRITG